MLNAAAAAAAQLARDETGYDSLEIRVLHPRPKSRLYRVELTGVGSIEPVEIRLEQAELLGLFEDAEAYGRALGKMVFGPPEMQTNYVQALATSRADGPGLRVRLRIDPTELNTLAWERIYHPVSGSWLPLASTATTPFSRFVAAEVWKQPEPCRDQTLKVLLVMSSPDGLEKAGLDPIDPAERLATRQMLASLPNVALTVIESGQGAGNAAGQPGISTLDALRRALPLGFHVLHFLCHGAHTRAGTVLYLDGADGQVEPVTAQKIEEALGLLREPPLLVFLAACESAVRAKTDAFVPLGPALVAKNGALAVVAMNDQVGVTLARDFSTAFYGRVLTHGVVDLAVNEARAIVQGAWDWGVPVLFSRLPDNRLLLADPTGLYGGYLAHSDTAMRAAGAAIAESQAQHGGELIQELQVLVTELSHSHEFLSKIASAYRRTGSDPATFAVKFETFYYDFKDQFDSHTWVEDKTSCRRIHTLQLELMPKLRAVFDAATIAALEASLEAMNDSDGQAIQHFGSFFEEMNTAVEAIWAKVQAGDIAGAISLKQAFEAQISNDFAQSRAILGEMSGHIDRMAKAA